jgi:pantoate--beta-alanine ligase
MQIIRGAHQMQAAAEQARAAGKRIGFVPTMGALHEGHLSLVRMAHAQTNWVVVSIFVNPLQFGPNEDLARYPRPFEQDRELLQAENVDALFAPSADEIYPAGSATIVDVEGMSGRLCGASRPGHFRGVTTVVAKLFNIVRPHIAFFGQKDAAQVAIIKRMVRDLNFDVQITVGPIVRERDGLAMSSRNQYLDPKQRVSAGILYRALMRIQQLADSGERRAHELLQASRDVVAEEPDVRMDYIEAVNPDSLEPLQDISGGALIAIAAWFGPTRLIDNILLSGAMNAAGPH